MNIAQKELLWQVKKLTIRECDFCEQVNQNNIKKSTAVTIADQLKTSNIFDGSKRVFGQWLSVKCTIHDF